MAQQDLEFKNILVMHFGQLGDVVLGLPALRAVRQRFPNAKITVISGTSTSAIIKLANIADGQISVDRVRLRDGNKLRSISEIFKIVRDVRRRRFDLAIDLHSLSETNLMGFLAGIPQRLYADRKGRSINRLANYPVKPPREDRTKHATHRYLDVIVPLGVENVEPVLDLKPALVHIAEVRAVLKEHSVEEGDLVGMFLGAGHPSRRWPLEKYAELATRLIENGSKVIVFLGPEEIDLVQAVAAVFPASVIVLDKLKLLPLFAALTFLKVLVSNDTGPTHLAAATKSSIVLITGSSAPTEFLPLTDHLTVVNSGPIDEIAVDEVFAAVRSSLENDFSAAAC